MKNVFKIEVISVKYVGEMLLEILTIIAIVYKDIMMIIKCYKNVRNVQINVKNGNNILNLIYHYYIKIKLIFHAKYFKSVCIF